MGIQQEKGGFMLKGAIGALTESVASFWKPMLVAAPLIGTALFFASGTFAQTSGGVAPTASASSSGPVAPIETAAAARRKGPKVKVKEAMDTSRVANPPTTTEPVAQPEAARTGRPKERDPTPTNDSVASPPATTEPVAQPTERRRKGPKVRDDPVRDTSRTGGRPKERDDGPRPPLRVNTPKPRTSLLLPALGGAAAIAAIIVATSGNDRPSSP